VSHASALAFKAPRATSEAEVGDFVFPPEPTAAPKFHVDLLRRQEVMTDLIAPDNTCGYISGLAGTFPLSYDDNRALLTNFYRRRLLL
jgi:hypothetical protein